MFTCNSRQSLTDADDEVGASIQRHLAKTLRHKSDICSYYQAIIIRLVGKQPLGTYMFAPLWRCRGFVRTGRFVTVQLYSHGLVPRRFVTRIGYICCGLWGLFYVFRETIRHAYLNPPLFSTAGPPAIEATASSVVQDVRFRILLGFVHQWYAAASCESVAPSSLRT